MNIREDAFDKHVAVCTMIKDGAFYKYTFSAHINTRCAYCKKYMHIIESISEVTLEDNDQMTICRDCPLMQELGAPCCSLPEWKEMSKIEEDVLEARKVLDTSFRTGIIKKAANRFKPVYKRWLVKIGFYEEVKIKVPEIAEW